MYPAADKPCTSPFMTQTYICLEELCADLYFKVLSHLCEIGFNGSLQRYCYQRAMHSISSLDLSEFFMFSNNKVIFQDFLLSKKSLLTVFCNIHHGRAFRY